MSRLCVVLLAAAAALIFLLAVSCATPGSAQANNCQGVPNTIPPWDGQLTFVNSTKHGKLYVAGPPDNQVSILHLFGTPYEMGVAQGQLLRDKIHFLIPSFYTYVEQTLATLPILKDLPPSILEKIATFGANLALDWELLETGPYIPRHFWEEMTGIADGSGISAQEIYRIHMFPELIKAQCSMFGAWGEATAQSTKGLVQLRALDFGTDNPFRMVPVLAVYHPNQGQGNKYAHLTFAGFLGAFTGYGEATAICEKLWDASDYNGTSKRAGIPWNFMLRDILQFDQTIDEAQQRMEDAHRTCPIFIGVGDHQSGTFRAFEYSYSVIRSFNDTTPFPGYAPMSPEHPLFTDLVYIDKHTQPSNDPCMASLLQENYGQIDPQNTISLVGQFETGDLHAAVYDFAANNMYIGVATQTGTYPPANQSAVFPAYSRQFLKLNMTQLFAEQS